MAVVGLGTVGPDGIRRLATASAGFDATVASCAFARTNKADPSDPLMRGAMQRGAGTS